MTPRMALVVGLLVVAPASAAAAAPQDVANDISRRIMSPYCPGVTLHDCPSDSAVALRDRITEMAAEGMARDEIMDELVAEFGETIRAEPPRSGRGLFAWVLPAAALAGAAATAWTLSRRWTATGPGAATPTSEVSASDRRRVEAELDRLRGPA